MSVLPPTRARLPRGRRTSTRRERVGWYFYDSANSAFAPPRSSRSSSVRTCTDIAQTAAGVRRRRQRLRRCAAVPAGDPGRADLYYSYVLSLSVILQVLVLPITGALADRTAHRRRLLRSVRLPARAATIGFLFLTGDRYLLGGALFVVANVAFRGPASWSTTRSRLNWPVPRIATRCPASAGRSATSVAACCWC